MKDTIPTTSRVCAAQTPPTSRGSRLRQWTRHGEDCYDPADPTACAAIFPWESGTSDFPKVETWSQSGYDQDGVASDPYAEQIETSLDRTFNSNLDDQSWENPFDVAKGHRGFLDGDFLYHHVRLVAQLEGQLGR